MTADRMVRDAIERVPGAVAAGIVDLDSALMLVISTDDSHPQQILDLLAQATREIFEGERILPIEKLFETSTAVGSEERGLEEILIGSGRLWHYFARVEARPRTVLAVVARADGNMGLFLVRAREIRDSGRP